jgi:hypothetical protein
MGSVTLTHLIGEFLKAVAVQERSIWREADIAQAIARRYGPKGLQALHAQAGLSVHRLEVMARIARAYPEGERYAVSFAHHVAALGAHRLFADGAPEHEPAYWLQRAVTQHWSRSQMLMRMRRTVTVDADEATRRRTVNRRFVEAAQHHQEIRTAAAAFNGQEALFWQSYVLVVDIPVGESLTPEDVLARVLHALGEQLPQVAVVPATQPA